MSGAIDNAAHIGGLVSGFACGYLAGSSLSLDGAPARKAITHVLFVTLMAGFCWMGLSMTTNTMKIYEERMEIFRVRENEALAILQMDTGVGKEDVIYQLVERGVYYWEENIELLNELGRLDLPDDVSDMNKRLLEYCKLRVESYILMAEWYEDGGTKHHEVLETYERNIKDLFD